MRIRLFIAGCVILWPAMASAGPASDTVGFFYVPDHWMGDPVYRDRFVDPARHLFDLNDQAPEDEVGCIDFDPAIDAQDLDDATLKKTLELKEKVEGDSAAVTATFDLFPGGGESHREMLWSLKKVGGSWKIADVTSVTNGWSLGQLQCGPGQ